MPMFPNATLVVCKPTASTLLALGSDTVGAAGPLVGAKFKLFKDNITLTPATELADLGTLATLAGAGVALTFTAPVNVDADTIAIKAQAEAIAGADPTVEDVRGVAVVNAAADQLLAAYKFPDPVSIAQEGDYISADLLFKLPMRPLT